MIYHGASQWRSPTHFHDLIWPLPAVLAPFVPQFQCALHDISARTSAEIKGDVLTRLVQLALRDIFSDQPVARLRELLGLIARVNDQGTALEILESLLRYYVQGTQRVDEHDVRVLLQQTPSGDPLMQTFIDRYIEQGRVQGWVQGQAQGIEQGKQQGEAAVLLRLILLKFGPPSPAVYRLVSAADAETLLRWSERILTAESVDALLN